jgi:shikimate kinase
VIESTPPRRIALVGFMAAGKTTVGRLLARRLGWTFVDLDTWIEVRAGLAIPELFARHGEPAFRELEREVAREALALPRCVIATGGGAFAEAETRELLRSGALCVWLQVDLPTILARLERGRHRPLAADRATIPALLTLRERSYQQADRTIATLGRTPRALAQEIAEGVASGRRAGTR